MTTVEKLPHSFLPPCMLGSENNGLLYKCPKMPGAWKIYASHMIHSITQDKVLTAV